MGQSGTDIRLIGAAKEAFPFSVECKWQETWSVHQWVRQAQENQMDDMPWLLVCKKSRKQPIAIMDIDVFFKLVEQAMMAVKKL